MLSALPKHHFHCLSKKAGAGGGLDNTHTLGGEPLLIGSWSRITVPLPPGEKKGLQVDKGAGAGIKPVHPPLVSGTEGW